MFTAHPFFYYLILILSAFFIIFFLLVSEFILVIIMLVPLTFSIWKIKRSGDIGDLASWTSQKGFKLYKKGNRKFVKMRHAQNPGKRFGSRKHYLGLNFGPFAEGKIQNRNIWIYSLYGMSGLASGFPYYGWCIEIITNDINFSAEVTHEYMGHTDSIDTESNEFEKKYRIQSSKKSIVLQLLDPVMMELINDNFISGIEFSDKSILLYNTSFPPKRQALDNLLTIGQKIAEQVDRNFPMGKYNN